MWKQPKEYTVMIVDLNGRLIRQWSEAAATVSRKAIPVSEIPAGNYLIQIKAGNEQIVKQFSVMH
jgi:hypothetical protein